ncbi:MAG: glycosyl hydrolase [Planctomycetota bacterium]
MDPENPEILYASSYQRRRHTWVLINGGPGSGLHKSTDGGETWREINRGLPGGDKGRIGMAVSPINPEVLYAIVEAQGGGGFYRSSNRGESWTKMSSEISSSPQYYQELVACPHNFDRIYSLDTYNRITEDGGATWSNLGESNKHVDNHAMIIDPADADHLICGCDGGVYESWDRGRNWDFKANLPLTQFYKVAVSYERPFYHVYGGTQDNATQGGPSQTNNTHGIRNSDWFITVFGDGFEPAVDPLDPDTIYSQWQYGGLVRFNRKTGERVDIKPQPEQGGPALRWNWDSALMISPHASERLYYGSQILFRSDDRGDSWTPVSEDLSRNLDRNTLKVMGRIWGVDAVAKNASTSLYGTIVSVSESPLEEGLIYVGTDDGMVQITEDGGENWRAVSKFGSLDVPEYGYINDIEADLHDPDTVYVAVNNHKRGDFKPYIVKSTDRGHTWTVIHSDLPERGSVYTLKQDHENENLMFCGTEFGCFFTIDGGAKWSELSAGLPTIAVRDIDIQTVENDLVLATFGRGFYILDDYSPLRELSEEMLDTNHIFEIKEGKIFAQANPLAGSGRAFQGANFYIADNPEYGVAITYHLKDSLKTLRQERESRDRRSARAGQDTPYPSWDELKEEDRELSPRVVLTIRDSDGEVVSRLNGSTSRGMHRTHWDMELDGFGFGGPLAPPGTYSVDIAQIVNDETTVLVEPVDFEIAPVSFGDTSDSDQEAIVEFAREAAAFARAVQGASEVLDATEEALDEIEDTIKSQPDLDQELLVTVHEMQSRLMDINEKFSGDPTRSRRNESAYPGFQSRIRTMMFGAMGSTEGPTATHRTQFEIAEAEYNEVIGDLRKLVEKDLPKLHRQLDEAGAPWTPGRRIPVWN